MENITQILLDCENNGTAPRYIVQPDTYKQEKYSLFKKSKPVRTNPVKYKSNGEEIFVVSDLHIGTGKDKAGVYPGTENFFADDSFSRFLEYAGKIKKTKSAILVINGDIFDFLRITEFPGKIRKARFSKRIRQLLKFNPLPSAGLPDPVSVKNQFEEWSLELAKIGISKTAADLEIDISSKEKKYGLRTDAFKTVFKLMMIKKGHPLFFDALGRWLNSGNKIIVVKGNHDLELFWFEIRNYLRLLLAEKIHTAHPENELGKILTGTVLPNISFIDDSIEIDDEFYIEHGHRYDKYCTILDNPVLKKNTSQLNIPFGSFFNRYLLNRAELFFPFLDNVKPSANILPILMRENFPLSLKILFQHIPLLVRVLFTNFRYIRYMLGKIFLFVLALVLPVALLLLINFPWFKNLLNDISEFIGAAGFAATVIEQLRNVAMVFLSYLLARLVAWFQLTEPTSLNEFAKERFNGTDYKFMTMGHTHNPGTYVFPGNRKFFNTGTWIPIVETSTAEIREDKTYVFLHLQRDKNNNLTTAEHSLLQRWNDNAGRPENLVLIKRK